MAFKIAREAHNNITMAKLGLDAINTLACLDSIEQPTDRLPRNVQAIFGEGVRKIGQQPSDQRDLALKEIAAISKFGPNFIDVTVSQLNIPLRDRSHVFRKGSMASPSKDDIIKAAKGYLHLLSPRYGIPEYSIDTYNVVFHTYASESYNDNLTWAFAQLRTSSITRQFTILSPKNEEGV